MSKIPDELDDSQVLVVDGDVWRIDSFEADQRGRINLGSDHADQTVRVAVIGSGDEQTQYGGSEWGSDLKFEQGDKVTVTEPFDPLRGDDKVTEPVGDVGRVDGSGGEPITQDGRYLVLFPPQAGWFVPEANLKFAE